MADYPWEQCMADQMKRYGSKEIAAKVCGSIRANAGALVEQGGAADMAEAYRIISQKMSYDPIYAKSLTGLHAGSFSEALQCAGDKGQMMAPVLFDTGASESFVSRGIAEKVATITDLPQAKVFTAADGKQITMSKCCMMGVDMGGQMMQDNFLVQEEGPDGVTVGASTMKKYGISLSQETVTEALEAITPKGKKWEVRAIREGKSANHWIYTQKALETLVPLLNGMKIRAVKTAQGVFGHNGQVLGEIGVLSNGRGMEVNGFYEPRADAEIHEDRREWLLKAMEAREVGGLSINIPCDVVKLRDGDVWVKRFIGPGSLDLATVPSAGGAFLRATESQEGEFMNREKILELLKKRRPDIAGKLAADCTLEQAQEALEKALENDGKSVAQEAEDLKALKEQVQKDSCDAYLTRKLAESNLPEPVKKKIEKRFSNQIFAREALDQELTAEKETMDALVKSGIVTGAGDTRIEMGQEAVDNIQIALDRTLGVKVEGHTEIKPWRGLLEAYVQITGDSEVRGKLPKSKMRAQEAIVAADFPNLLGTSINRRLLADYAEVDYGESCIISPPYLTLSNFKLMEAERVGYFGDLDDVDPEAADYVEAAKPGEEKVSFTPIQKGNLLTITRKAILNDDLRGLQKRVQAWGRAARRTLARYVWNFFINNSNYTVDATAWFTVGHGNLTANVLTQANLSAAIDALAKMTEQDSGERLGLDAAAQGRLRLVVPQDLRVTAFQINQREHDVNYVPNELYQAFGKNNERIFVNPLMTDATDWGLFRDPSDIDIIVVGFINGQQDPEIFVADQLTVGQMFVADKVQYKIRHEYGAMIGDIRGAYKSVNP